MSDTRSEEELAKTIHARINAIMADIGAVRKERSGEGIRFTFRGIEDAYAVTQPLLVTHEVNVWPVEVEIKDVREYTTRNGALGIHVIALFTWCLEAPDGSQYFAKTLGEGMDTSDKACAKAASISQKYLIWQTFWVPTEEQIKEDPDRHRPEAEPPRSESETQDMVGLYRAKIKACTNPSDLKLVAHALQEFPEVRGQLRTYYNRKKAKLTRDAKGDPDANG